MFERAVKVGPLTSDEYKQLKADLQRRARAQIDGALAKHKPDAPTASSPTSSTSTCRRRWRARRSTWHGEARRGQGRPSLRNHRSCPPPTANALDFLDAPQRLMEALDSATMKWFVQAFQAGGKFSLNLIAKSAATILRAIGRITGGAFLEAMAEFIGELNDLFGGFKERAARVEAVLRGDEVAFVLVTSASPPSIQEVLYFAERLTEANMPRGAFVVNRFHTPPPRAAEGLTTADASSAIAAHHVTHRPKHPRRPRAPGYNRRVVQRHSAAGRRGPRAVL